MAPHTESGGSDSQPFRPLIHGDDVISAVYIVDGEEAHFLDPQTKGPLGCSLSCVIVVPVVCVLPL